MVWLMRGRGGTPEVFSLGDGSAPGVAYTEGRERELRLGGVGLHADHAES